MPLIKLARTSKHEARYLTSAFSAHTISNHAKITSSLTGDCRQYRGQMDFRINKITKRLHTTCHLQQISEAAMPERVRNLCLHRGILIAYTASKSRHKRFCKRRYRILWTWERLEGSKEDEDRPEKIKTACITRAALMRVRTVQSTFTKF